MECPIVVGGTGGSGTRLVSQILCSCGVFMGVDVNYACDSLPMSKFDSFYMLQHPGSLQEMLAKQLEEHLRGHPGGLWGWKHTYSYITLPALHYMLGREMTFIHIVRDGRDMAYGEFVTSRLFGTGTPVPASPETIIALWATTNLACNNYGQRFLGKNYLLVRYEDLCKYPQQLPKMLGLVYPQGLLKIVRPSLTMGRWRGQKGIDGVTAIGEYALKRFGYL